MDLLLERVTSWSLMLSVNTLNRNEATGKGWGGSEHSGVGKEGNEASVKVRNIPLFHNFSYKKYLFARLWGGKGGVVIWRKTKTRRIDDGLNCPSSSCHFPLSLSLDIKHKIKRNSF